MLESPKFILSHLDWIMVECFFVSLQVNLLNFEDRFGMDVDRNDFRCLPIKIILSGSLWVLIRLNFFLSFESKEIFKFRLCFLTREITLSWSDQFEVGWNFSLSPYSWLWKHFQNRFVYNPKNMLKISEFYSFCK